MKNLIDKELFDLMLLLLQLSEKSPKRLKDIKDFIREMICVLFNNGHSLFSASSSNRWIRCPDSIRANLIGQAIKNENNDAKKEHASMYSYEGNVAHRLAENCFKSEKEASCFVGQKILGMTVTDEMAYYVQKFIKFVNDKTEEGSLVLVERKVNYSKEIDGGFGTLDIAIVNYKKKECHVIDFKFGKWVRVSSVKNTQLMLYALGLCNDFRLKDKISRFHLHIVQPRMKNFCNSEISLYELKEFEKTVIKRANMALGLNAPRKAGAIQCTYCIAKPDCKSYANFVLGMLKTNLYNLNNLNKNTLTEEEKLVILDNEKLITSLVSSIKEDYYNKLLRGQSVKGFKLVAGNRKTVLKKSSEKDLRRLLKDRINDNQEVSLTQARAFLTPKQLEEFVEKKPTSPIMVSESDKRPALDLQGMPETS